MDTEARFSNTTHRHGGGWITFPFIIGSTGALTLAAGGWMYNLIVYLIQEFQINSIDAAQIFNLVFGSTAFIPVVAAIIADSFLGCYAVVWISSFISFLGITLLFLTSTLHFLRPQPCDLLDESSICRTPTKLQYTTLYTAIILASTGFGGLRTTLGTMGANQFVKPKDQGAYFSWYFVTIYFFQVLSISAIVYVEDEVSWALGFGLCVGANLLGSVVFLVGFRFYYYPKLGNSPFTTIAQVIVAALRKRKVPLLSETKDYYFGHGSVVPELTAAPSKRFRFLNRAALKTNGDIEPDGSNANPWKTCTVLQVEQLKTLIKIFPLWSSSIFLVTPIGIQGSLVVLQALTMDRQITAHFKVPAASIRVFALISTAIFLTIWDRILMPTCKNHFKLTLTPLQRIGTGHILTIISICISAIVEKERLNLSKSAKVLEQGNPSNLVVPMSVLWLVPQLVVIGIGEALHFPGQVELYYQEFPPTLKSLSTAMSYLIVAIAFYLSAALIDLVGKVTTWFPNDINHGRLDNVYWVCVVIGVVNFCYYLVCACLYKYQNVGEGKGGPSSS